MKKRRISTNERTGLGGKGRKYEEAGLKEKRNRRERKITRIGEER